MNRGFEIFLAYNACLQCCQLNGPMPTPLTLSIDLRIMPIFASNIANSMSTQEHLSFQDAVPSKVHYPSKRVSGDP